MFFVSNLYASVRMFTNVKSNLIRRIFKRNNYKVFNKRIVEATTRIASAYRVTSSNSNCTNNAFSRFILTNARDKVTYQVILI